ncbi:MAG: hypothetical protein U5K79_17590 [Cyclobacteriaceae bacterium]|nr:hypothetical protein [Cyclobacteriaceae bacterium]
MITDLFCSGGGISKIKNITECSDCTIRCLYRKLPEDPDFLITSCSPRGTALCCTAEAFLMAFECHAYDFRGNITLDGFNLIHDLAVKHGFIQNTGFLKSYKSTMEDAVSV